MADNSKDIKNVTDDTTATPAVKLFSRSEVEKHTDPKDIWIIIHNNVYNISNFLNEHPGGEEVLIEQAGHDATEPFEDIGHSTDARKMMESYKIGELPEEEKTVKKTKSFSKDIGEEDNSSSWRSWLIPLAIGLLSTFAYRYFFINTH